MGLKGRNVTIDQALREELLGYQRNEITECHIYRQLAKAVKSPENRRILQQIADDELGHYQKWKTYIALFNYYISVAKDESFKQRFLEMAGLSLGVAGLSFVVGLLIREFLGVEI